MNDDTTTTVHDMTKTTPTRWAAQFGPKHVAALKLLTGLDIVYIQRGLSAQVKMKSLREAIDKMEAVKIKLDGIVEAGK